MKLMTYRTPLSSFESIFNDPFEAFAPLFEARPPKSETSLEWFEDDSNYYVRLDLPGVKKENLHLEFEGDIVTVSFKDAGSREDESSEQKRLRVPEDIEAESAAAKLENGVLTLTLPKVPEKGPVTINIA